MSELDDILIPLPSVRQIHRKGAYFYLGDRGIGMLDASTDYLTKRVQGNLHAFRRRPGVAWNLELLAVADRNGCRGLHIQVVTPEHTYEYRLPWEVVKRYALAAVGGDTRYLLKWDTDDQVLIPWDAWRGKHFGPSDREPKKKNDNQGTLI